MDEGRTWPLRRNIEQGEGSFSYPSLTQSPDGQVHVTYTYKRSHIQHATFNEAWMAGGVW